MWSDRVKPIVEVSRDVLGWLLVYARDHEGNREGEPLGAPDYYRSRAAAKREADKINGAHRTLAERAGGMPATQQDRP